MSIDDNAILIENLFFQFTQKKKSFSLSIASLAIEKGERAALVGPSGSGKSTLLGLICGVLQPTRGHVGVFGNHLEKMSSRHRDQFRADMLGIIFQQFNLLPYLSVLDNVALALEFSNQQKLSSVEKRERAMQLLASLDLDASQIGHQKVSELSVGQQQRVAAARAFIGKPPLIIADEPTSALDEGRQSEFLDLLFQQEETDATLLMVTHDPRVASRFDRVMNLTDVCVTSDEKVDLR